MRSLESNIILVADKVNFTVEYWKNIHLKNGKRVFRKGPASWDSLHNHQTNPLLAIMKIEPYFMLRHKNRRD